MITQAINITIPKPCHEDWDKMTPDQKGAFCGVCQKSVVDFSKKTDEEIIKTIKAEANDKICGRFAPSQLNRPIAKTTSELPLKNKFSLKMKAFAAALYFVFGFSLFACGQKHPKVGKIAVKGELQFDPPKTDTTYTPKVADSTKTVNNQQNEEILNVTGDVQVTYPMGGPRIVECELPTIGEPSIDTINDQTITDTLTENTEINILGNISTNLPHTVEVDAIAPVDSTFVDTSNNNTTDINEIVNLPVDFNVMVVYPNPNKGSINVSYELTQKSDMKLELYDINGKFIKTLTSVNQQYAGKYLLTFDLNDLSNGNYMCVLIAGNTKQSSQIVISK